MAGCPAICQEVDLQFCPAVVFFSALHAIDDEAQIVAADVRRRTLELTAERLRGNDPSQLQLAKMTELLASQIAAGDFDFVTPIALLKASAACTSGALEAGFHGAGLSIEIILNRIESDLPAEKLADEPEIFPRPDPPKYAVVIEGPGFRDRRNRYPTLAKAEYAAELLGAALKGVQATHEGPYESSIMYSRPPQFEKTTKIYVEELQSPSSR
jgi:hypothetical protein